MGLFDQFFGKKKIEKNIKDSQYLPEKKDPVHIEFAQNFVARGGKFVYCESPQDTHYFFQQILNECAVCILMFVPFCDACQSELVYL